ncbi:hypothetical protein [Lentzea sp. NPDC092896]|uniref:hypothetical protein n=1 Tax=Lentzea sp. NPDC092896 TaxID=3364127 RepID=UPI0038172043
MEEFTAGVEQVFGVAPSLETGLVLDTFDGAGLGTGAEAALCFCTQSVSPCRACGATRVAAAE